MAQTQRRRREAEDEYGKYVHFRAPPDLIELIDAFAAQATAKGSSMNRSHAIRTLLFQALTSEPERAHAVQVQYDYATVQRLIVARISKEISAVLPDIMRKVVRENGG